MKIPMPKATASELRKARLSRLLPAISIIVIILAFAAGWWIWSGSNRIVLDNARIEGLRAIISPRISGYVSQVHVTDGQKVERGHLLFQLDDQTLKTELAQAESELARTTTKVPPEYLNARIEAGAGNTPLTLKEALDKQIKTEAEARQAHIAASSELAQARLNAERARMAAKDAQDGQAQANLIQAAQRLDSAAAAEKKTRENFETASLIRAQTEQGIRNMQNLAQQSAYHQDPRLLDIALAEYDAAKAKTLEAQKNLESAAVRAPIAGTVSDLSIQPEQHVERGAPCLAINSSSPADLYAIGFTNADGAGRIVAGMACKLRPKGWSGPDLEGTVKAVLPPVSEDRGDASRGGGDGRNAQDASDGLYPVHIAVSGYDPDLMPALHNNTPCRVEVMTWDVTRKDAAAEK